MAMDCAVSSPVQLATPRAAAEVPLAAAMGYEQKRLDDRDAVVKCEAWGVCLVPMVLESFGGWGLAVQKAFKSICSASAGRTGESFSIATSFTKALALSSHVLRHVPCWLA